MALEKGVNSYATVAEADDYFADRLGAATWTAAADAQKAQALVTATSIVDQNAWLGFTESSLLAFPREGSFWDPSLGVEVAMDPVPTRITKAVFELALHLLNNEGVLTAQQAFNSITVDVISLDFKTNVAKVPYSVTEIYRPLLLNQGGNSWWRAN